MPQGRVGYCRLVSLETRMSYLVLGLLLFLGIHSIRIVADGWRMARVARLGENRWKGLYSLASALGLGLVLLGVVGLLNALSRWCCGCRRDGRATSRRCSPCPPSS